MPTYQYLPPNNMGALFTNFSVYDPTTRTKTEKRILPNQTFATDRYMARDTMEKTFLKFISDTPYISPILISYSGNESNTIEVPEYSNLIDIYVSLKTYKSCYISLYFNGNIEGKIDIFNSGKVFRNISVSKIRTITTIPNDKCDYTIALVDSDQFASNNTGEQVL